MPGRRHQRNDPSPISQAVIVQLGGAQADHGPRRCSLWHRDAAQAFFAAGGWSPEDPGGDRHGAWARSTWEAIRPHSTESNYVNWQTADEDDSRCKKASGDNLDRLATVRLPTNRTTCPAEPQDGLRAVARRRWVRAGGRAGSLSLAAV